MFSRASFTTGAISRTRSSTARALRTDSRLNRSSSVTNAAVAMGGTLSDLQFPAARRGRGRGFRIAHDPAGRRLIEMAADDQHVFVGEAIDERLARAAARFLVHVEATGARRVGELDRVM